MKLKPLALITVTLLMALIVSPVMAMYDPAQGRFLQRDPRGTAVAMPARVGASRAAPSGGFVPLDPTAQYADGANLYQYEGSNPVFVVDPTGKVRQVFAFEGLSGYPGDLIHFSYPFVLKDWGPKVADAHGKWHYYAEHDVSSAISAAVKIAKEVHKDKKGNCYYDTIIVLGYSNGGEAAVQFAAKLKAKNIAVNLGFTADPIPKIPQLLNPFILFNRGKAVYKPANVNRWVNWYQHVDDSTLIPFLGLKGNRVKGADQNTQLLKADFGSPQWHHAHLYITSNPRVLKSLSSELKAVSERRDDWRYKK